MSKKVLSVDNIDVIKDYILSKIIVESDDIKRTLTEENAKYLQHKLVEAAERIKDDYDSKVNDLTERIEQLKLEGVDNALLRELELRLDALKNNYVDQKNSISKIEDSVLDIKNSVMSPGQLNELIETAFIDGTYIQDDSVSSPNMFTQNLVALIAKFGTIRALNIIGDVIEGKTLSAYVSPDDKDNGIEPSWKLNKDGDGYLANGNITWDKDGDVTFGNNVVIGWDSIKDAVEDKLPEGGVSLDQVEDKITTQLSRYEIKSEQLTGKTITGATVQSSGNAWKLGKDGDGYLANGNITWDKDGKVTFGDDVTIGWGNVTDAPSDFGSVSESKVEEIIGTKITKDYIESLEVRATDIIGNTIKGKTIKNTDGIWEINNDGTGWLSNKKVTWSKNTFNIHDSIKINSDNTIDIGPIHIDEIGNITDNSICYLDLTSQSLWPQDEGTITCDFPVATELYCYNAAGYTKAHISLGEWTLNFNLCTKWGENKYIKVYFGVLDGQGYKINFSFLDYDSKAGADIIKIIGWSKIGNGSLIYPTNNLANSMYLETQKTYLFKCETKDDQKIMRFITEI